MIGELAPKYVDLLQRDSLRLDFWSRYELQRPIRRRGSASSLATSDFVPLLSRDRMIVDMASIQWEFSGSSVLGFDCLIKRAVRS